jgi:hypothetical protein
MDKKSPKISFLVRYNYQKGTVTAVFEYGSVADPDSVESLDPYPDPDSQSGSGSKRAKMAQKIENG